MLVEFGGNMNNRIDNVRNRKSLRLKYYDYSQAGLYFITICTQNRLHLFGEIVNDEMVLNDAGLMIEKIWHEIPNNFSNTKLHKFIIMPNHIHGIIEIIVGAPLVGARNPMGAQIDNQPQTGQPQGIAPTVGGIVGVFKSLTTNAYIKMVKQNILPPFDKHIWQRNYWEHIIRNENEYDRITQYIKDNPKKWALDKLNVGADLRVCPNRVREQSAIYNDEAWMI